MENKDEGKLSHSKGGDDNGQAPMSEGKHKGEVANYEEIEPFDMDGHISPYVGIAKVQRLLHIARRCPYLRQRAFCMAVDELKQTKCTQVTNKQAFFLFSCTAKYFVVLFCLIVCRPKLYTNIVHEAQAALTGTEHGIYLDSEWAQTVNSKYVAMHSRLDTSMIDQRLTQDHEALRKSLLALGDLHHDRGDWPNALTVYGSMKEHCSTNIHMAQMCKAIVKTNIHGNTLTHVVDHARRLTGFGNIEPALVSFANMALGLHNLKGWLGTWGRLFGDKGGSEWR